ncbi:hypothetical protein PHLCEN_2v13112 [Hermanssonia centrifuga]|uniref:Uncharacterized protein n=1 Tax=Hermanssonia centrifuga TaxID=98765 RepID=A0A2R6NFH0_9APHY|nr:hypothetical protein PHLCEN_2v13112 [Hermanssonia centrifuga]
MASNSGLPVSTYALDFAAALTYTATNTSVSTYQNQFYKSPTLQDGLHTLVITITSQGAEYWLDYLLYTPSSNDLASAAMSPSSSTSEALLTATSFAGSAASSTSSSCALANNSQSSSFPIGP